MSKKSKKTKFNKVAVTWKEDDLMLPTIAAPIAPRRSYGAGGFDRGGFGSNRGGYGNSDKQEESASDRGPWRRGPASQPHSTSNSNSFTSNRNPPRNAGSSFNSFRSANTRSPSNDTPDDLNASENDRNWRNSKKKEQPKISLNSTISSTNINPWRNNNNNSNSRAETQGSGSGRNAFGSKSLSQTATVAPPNSFSRTSFGSRSNNTFSDSNSGNGSRYGASKFGGGSSSKYGGGGGSSSTSKFNTGGGFGAAALKNIDNGTTRLSYSRNNRFSGIMEENKAENSVRFEAPSKSVGNRFSKMSVSAAASEETAFPGLRNAKTQRMRKEKTVEELNKAIKKDIARSNSERNKMELLAQEQAQKKKKAASAASKSKPGKKKINVIEESGKKKAAKSEKKVKVTEPTKETKKQSKQKRKQELIAKADKKLVRKFNRDHLVQNKYIEINGDTERMILCGLSQKGNILKRDAENYEKIANLVCTVILNDQKGNKIDLDLIYDMLYNKTLLSAAKNEFLALILEILSLIEIKKSCLSVVHMIDSRDISNKYLMKTPDITRMATMKEFEEYGLQYIYPLQPEIVATFQELIDKSPSMEDIINLMQTIKKKQIIYSNYKSIHSILAYVLNAFYFAKISGNEEENEAIAKALIVGGEKTHFSQIIELLHCKHEEEKHDEEEEEDDDDVDSHSLLILSSIISISSENKNNHNGLLSILKVMELNRLMPYKTVQKFVLCDEDKNTSSRLNALSKLTDWIAELDARQSRIAMERDNDEYEEDEDVDNTYAGNLLAQRKHKTAADYEQISYIDVE